MLQGSVVADGEVGIVSGLRTQIVVLAILRQGVVTALNTKDQQTVDDGVVLHAVQRNSGTLHVFALGRKADAVNEVVAMAGDGFIVPQAVDEHGGVILHGLQ